MTYYIITFERNLDKMQRKGGNNRIKEDKAKGYSLSATICRNHHEDLYIHYHIFLTTATIIFILQLMKLSLDNLSKFLQQVRGGARTQRPMTLSPCVKALLCSRLYNATPVNQSVGTAISAYDSNFIKVAKWTGFFCGTLAHPC